MIKPEMRMFLVLPQPPSPPNSNGVVNVNVLSVLMRCFLSQPSYLLPSFFFFCILLSYSFCPLPSWHPPPPPAPSLLPMFRLRQALPFASGPANKARVAGLLFVFLGTGWITPFLAAKWTIEKNGRSNKWCGN